MRLLFVCLGNICRSPTAEGVMRSLLEEEGLHDRVQVDSAGTGSWHVGSPPDRRAAAEAERRGVALGGEARQVTIGDLDRFDLVIAMDSRNREDLVVMTRDGQTAERIRLLREFDPEADAPDVPDPYLEGGFDEVFEIVERSCRGLLEEVTARLDGR